MRERLKKKGREGKVEAFVKGLNSGSFDVVNYDYLSVSHKFTGGKLLDKVENKTINGGKTDGLQIWSWRVEELSTNLEAEGKEYEDPEEQISNGLVDPNAINDIVILPISPNLSHEELEK
ncbi:hypothetical protein BY996DRAFT_8436915 [Phakopsora pachyrhizi]|nr:hypothetical protein BY996DRAFT_8436915 [Phakopsora pachyrhizi]